METYAILTVEDCDGNGRAATETEARTIAAMVGGTVTDTEDADAGGFLVELPWLDNGGVADGSLRVADPDGDGHWTGFIEWEFDGGR